MHINEYPPSPLRRPIIDVCVRSACQHNVDGMGKSLVKLGKPSGTCACDRNACAHTSIILASTPPPPPAPLSATAPPPARPKGLFGRGLSTRILANGLQSMVFTVVWRYLHDKYVVPWREAAELREGESLGGTVGSRRSSDRSRQS